jgi:hypothetical protein
LINAGEVYQARAILAREVACRDADNPAAWALMAHLVDDKAEEIHCLEQVLRLQPDNYYAKYRLLALRNNGTVREKPLENTARPFRFSENHTWQDGVDLSHSRIMPQGRKSKVSRGLPEIQAAWPIDLKFRTIVSPFSEQVQELRKPFWSSPAFRGAIDKLLLFAIISALSLLF